MKHCPELLILEGESSMGVISDKPHTGKVYYISRRRPWYHPITIWDGICKSFKKFCGIFKRKDE